VKPSKSLAKHARPENDESRSAVTKTITGRIGVPPSKDEEALLHCLVRHDERAQIPQAIPAERLAERGYDVVSTYHGRRVKTNWKSLWFEPVASAIHMPHGFGGMRDV
jgi:hypothetical protein